MSGKSRKKPQSEKSDELKLSDDERSQIQALQQNILRAQVALASADIQVVRAEEARNEARRNLLNASDALRQRLLGAVSDHGEDPLAQWDFDPSAMTLKKKTRG